MYVCLLLTVEAGVSGAAVQMSTKVIEVCDVGFKREWRLNLAFTRGREGSRIDFVIFDS